MTGIIHNLNFLKHRMLYIVSHLIVAWTLGNVQADIIGHVQTLDYLVCKAVENPQTGGGEKLSADLLQLFIVLDEIHDMLRDERDKGKNITQRLLDEGGLRLPSIKPNFSVIMRTFNWDEDESKVLGVTIKDTVKMWRNLMMGMDIVPTTEIDYALNQEKDKK